MMVATFRYEIEWIHPALETLQIELQAAAFVDSDAERDFFQKECADAVLSRLTDNARARTVLRMMVV